MASPSVTVPADAPRCSLRIALVSETYPPEVNGVAMTIGHMCEGLRRRRHVVQLIRPRQADGNPGARDATLEEVLVRGVAIPRYGELKFGLPAKRTLMRLWTLKRPDIVHVVTEGPLGWSAVAAARALSLPVSSDFHTNFHLYSRHYGVGWLGGPISAYLRRLHNRSDLTLVPTRALQRELITQGFRNVEVLARGVDTALFDPARRCAQMRHLWRVGDQQLAVIHVGRLAPEKNIDLVLRAFDALRADAKMIFVGDGPARAALQRRYPQHVFAGVRKGEDLARHYASADLFLFASLTETFGNVTTEALASGLGVVAYDYAAARDVIRHGDNGMLAPYGDEDAFIATARELAARPALLADMRARARQSVAALDWERIHDGFVATLWGLIRRHERRQSAETTCFVAPD